MRRGDVVTVAAGGGFGGKPRPALIVQADAFAETGTVIVALFTGDLKDASLFRPRFEPDGVNGLRSPSDLMIDILVTARREKLGKVIGRLSPTELERADRALTVFLGLAG